MDSFPLVILLPMATFALVIGWALWSRHKTKQRQKDDSIPKSSLAVDAPSDRRAP
ncbi:MAG: Loki-CTERM sorting domain-containing protein [Pseudomonadota bacterium]